MAYTTFIYRILGAVLIPCVFWLLCAAGLRAKYGSPMGGGAFDNGAMYGLYFSLGMYIVFYEIFTDYWVLGGCLSDGGKGLRYFRTSHSGVEVMRNIVSVDLMRRFLYCMIFSAIVFAFTAGKASFVMGLGMYCVIVGVLNGSRHVDGLQRNTGIAILAQLCMVFVNMINVALIENAGNVMLVCLAVLYCAAALCVSKVTVRRITVRIQGKEWI